MKKITFGETIIHTYVEPEEEREEKRKAAQECERSADTYWAEKKIISDKDKADHYKLDKKDLDKKDVDAAHILEELGRDIKRQKV